MGRLPLEGVRVIDLSIVWAGPHCTRLLADMGAQVIKVESARWFDLIRGPARPNHPHEGCYPGNDLGERPYNRHGYFNERNRNKLGITLDLKSEKGVALLKRLVAVSDVVIENFAVGTMQSLDLDYPALRQVKPEVIMVSMPSFGSTGPQAGHVGYGATNDQLSGFISVTGYDDGLPQNVGINASDPIAGQHAAGAILAALIYRARTGRGQHVDLSHRESAARLMGGAILDYVMNGRVPQPRGNRHPSMAPHGCYRCQGEEEWVCLAVASDHEWEALRDLLGLPPDERFADVVSRRRHQEELDRIIGRWTAQRSHLEAMRALQAAGLAAGAVVNGRELLGDPHLRERRFFESIPHPEAGTHDYMGVAWKMSATPGSIRSPAPCLGEHTEYVLQTLLGLSREEIASLAAEGVISNEPGQAAKGHAC